MKTQRFYWFLACILLVAPDVAAAKDAFYKVAVKDLAITAGVLPAQRDIYVGYASELWDVMYPTARIHGEGEAWVGGDMSYWNYPDCLSDNGYIAVKAPEGTTIFGELLVPASDFKGIQTLHFQIPPEAASPEARTAFYGAMEEYYRHLMRARLPGAAWFRQRADEARTVLTGIEGQSLGTGVAGRRFERWSSNDLGETFDLFTGGRALSENLQLDRLLRPTAQGEETVDISTLKGIDIEEINWKPLIAGKKPKLDPLAASVPADQHGLFFHSFKAMLRLMDEADTAGTPVLAWLEPRSEDSMTKDRYQTQLALSVSALSRMFGPQVVSSVAFTGSDPFLRMGSDVAILFEARNVEMLEQFIIKKQDAALEMRKAMKKSGELKQGKIAGTDYRAVVSMDRELSSYMAVLGNVVVVANSLAQLERIALATNGQVPAMAKLGEYTFFRDRYKVGEDGETGFLMVTDAAIRRWCGPKWRIGDSRRTRFAGVLTALQARHLRALKSGDEKELAEVSRQLEQFQLPGAGPLERSDLAVRSAVYGTASFLTPVLELDVSRVTEAEAEAYGWFRNRYQRNWREFFDPIAIRFTVDDSQVALDMSVMPLIASSDYREFISVTEGGKLEPWAGDPHEGALFRYGMAINIDSGPMREVGSFAVSMVPALQGNVLSWLGKSLTVYGDRDSFWEDLATTQKPEHFLERNFHRIPVALRVDVSSPLKVTAFLASVRAFIQQAAPDMTIWETRKHGEASYVCVRPTERVISRDDDFPREAALYYAVTPDFLLITLNEEMLKRALDRDRGGKADKEGALPWLGENVAFQVDAVVLKLLDQASRMIYTAHMQRQAWSNLPILNEWKRLWPDENPVKLHQRAWGTRLVCPGGGEYVWDEQSQTVSSTVYGHPGMPLQGPGLLRPPLSDLSRGSFGLTFENGGLRARAMLQRAPGGSN